MMRKLIPAAMLVSATVLSSANATEFRPQPPLAVMSDGPVILAQSGDQAFRVSELENEVRRLNGKVEELSFQLLQMQEEMRKMQEDLELRFQELEDQRSDASDPNKTDDVAVAKEAGENSLGKSEPSGENNPDVKTGDTKQVEPEREPQIASSDEGGSEAIGLKPLAPVKNIDKPKNLKPRVLGTLTFDEEGNVVTSDQSGERAGEKLAALPLPGVFSDGVDGGVEAAEYGPTPNAVLEVGQTALKNRRYKRAEGAIRAYLKAWPKDPKEGEARFYLAEALFWQSKYFDAANVYLDTHNAHPNAKTAPDNLLGLGLSLAGLNQREVACATYGEVLNQYPSASDRLGERLAAEQASAKC